MKKLTQHDGVWMRLQRNKQHDQDVQILVSVVRHYLKHATDTNQKAKRFRRFAERACEWIEAKPACYEAINSATGDMRIQRYGKASCGPRLGWSEVNTEVD